MAAALGSSKNAVKVVNLESNQLNLDAITAICEVLKQEGGTVEVATKPDEISVEMVKAFASAGVGGLQDTLRTPTTPNAHKLCASSA